MNYFSPTKPEPVVLGYIKNSFKVVGSSVIRYDGYLGTRSNGYRAFHIPILFSGVRNYKVQAHHISWYLATGKWPEYELDHFDFNRENNSFDNLREVRGAHRLEQHDYPSNIKGYYWDKGNKSFVCYTRMRKHDKKYIGRAKSESEAIRKVALARIDLENEWEEAFVDRKLDKINNYLKLRAIR